MHFLLIICTTVLAIVFSCGLLPQEPATVLEFTVRELTLSAEMIYSESSVAHTRFPAISRNEQSAKRFLDNLIMNECEQQGRNPFLTDTVITLILQQLNVTIIYTLLNCLTATSGATNAALPDVYVKEYFIINGLVVSVCTMADCEHPTKDVKPVPSEHLSFTGNIKTSNIVMSNWTKRMWQSVLNRVYERLTLGIFYHSDNNYQQLIFYMNNT